MYLNIMQIKKKIQNVQDVVKYILKKEVVKTVKAAHYGTPVKNVEGRFFLWILLTMAF